MTDRQNPSITAFWPKHSPSFPSPQAEPFVFNDWLPSYKEALHYATVRQAGETEPRGRPLPGSHGRSRLDHAESQATWARRPCTSQLFCWALCESQIFYMSKPRVVTSRQMCPGDDARVQCLPQYLDEMYRMLGVVKKTVMWHGTQEIPKQWKGFFSLFFFTTKLMHKCTIPPPKKTSFGDWNFVNVNFSSQWERNYCFYPLFKGHPEIGLFFRRSRVSSYPSQLVTVTVSGWSLLAVLSAITNDIIRPSAWNSLYQEFKFRGG